MIPLIFVLIGFEGSCKVFKKMEHKHKFFPGCCFCVLCFCLSIILWGAWVRISHSGDGCGQSWPSCQGKYFMDPGEQEKTWIEWIHRASSGLFGVTVLLLVVGAFFLKHSAVFKSALVALFFTISEALLGARLVLAGLTGGNDSLARVLTMNLHLLNSLLLTSSIFICWRLSIGKNFSLTKPNTGSDLFTPALTKIFIFVFFLIAFFGSVSSLSVSLFPSTSLWEGMALDFDFQSHWLVRLRLLHPVLAIICGGGFLLYYFLDFYFKNIKPKIMSELCPQKILIFCLCLALFSGLMNLVLLSPVFLKLTHLLIVYFLAMSFLLTLEREPHKDST